MDHAGTLKGLLGKIKAAEELVWKESQSPRFKSLCWEIKHEAYLILLTVDVEEYERVHRDYLRCIRGIHEECKIDLVSQQSTLDLAARLDRMRDEIQKSLAQIDPTEPPS
jgi:hypothetical protein